MENLRGLGSVRISKEFLLDKLQGNRKQHGSTYDKAMVAWHKKVVTTLEKELAKAKKNKTYQPTIHVSKPSSYQDSYDKVIDMLEASLDKEFVLTSIEFSQYVRDDWEWKSSFTTTVSGCYS